MKYIAIFIILKYNKIHWNIYIFQALSPFDPLTHSQPNLQAISKKGLYDARFFSARKKTLNNCDTDPVFPFSGKYSLRLCSLAPHPSVAFMGIKCLQGRPFSFESCGDVGARLAAEGLPEHVLERNTAKKKCMSLPQSLWGVSLRLVWRPSLTFWFSARRWKGSLAPVHLSYICIAGPDFLSLWCERVYVYCGHQQFSLLCYSQEILP